MPAIDALQALNTALIRNTLNGSLFIADHSVTTLDETTLFDATSGDLAAAGLPSADWSDAGYLDDGGAQFAQQINEQTITSWQSATPTRADITSKVTTLQVKAQETNLTTISTYVGIDPSVIKTTASANGVVRIDEASAPSARYVRAVLIAADEQSAGEYVFVRYLPYARISSLGNQSFGKGQPIEWDMTLTAYVDPTLGFAHTWMFGGAGWKSGLTAAGFTAGP